jgi:hypothetical protein
VTEQIDSFLSMFRRPTAARKERLAREIDAHKTPAQLSRKAERTSQVNFRCSPRFRDRLKAVVEAEDSSMADVLEKALELYEAAKARGTDREAAE